MSLLRQIKVLRLQLQRFLVVIHVPGDTMITQGMNGLSQGIRMQPLNQYNGNTLLSLLHRPVLTSTLILTWALILNSPYL